MKERLLLLGLSAIGGVSGILSLALHYLKSNQNHLVDEAVDLSVEQIKKNPKLLALIQANMPEIMAAGKEAAGEAQKDLSPEPNGPTGIGPISHS